MPFGINIRQARQTDCQQILQLMLLLADFEGYREAFKVTEDELTKRCFKRNDFSILVAETDNRLIAILVYYILPFSYDLTPWMFVKELYVEKHYRGAKVGHKLMKLAASICQKNGGSRIRWDVLKTNQAAQNFYSALGATRQDDWQGFQLAGNALQSLVED